MTPLKISVLTLYSSILGFGIFFRNDIAQFIDDRMEKSARIHEMRRIRLMEESQRAVQRKQEWDLLAEKPSVIASLNNTAPHTIPMSQHVGRNQYQDFLNDYNKLAQDTKSQKQ